MEEEFKRTQDHDTMRGWIEEHDGRPATIREADTTEIVGVVFAGEERGFREMTWEEFFDWFDASGLFFEYVPDVARGEEEFSYNFVSPENIDDAREDETDLAEVNEMAEENMHDQIAERDM